MNNLDWKKLLLFVGASAAASTLGTYANAVQSGQHMAFTTGNILVPFATTAVSTLLALFQTPPNQDAPPQQ